MEKKLPRRLFFQIPRGRYRVLPVEKRICQFRPPTFFNHHLTQVRFLPPSLRALLGVWITTGEAPRLFTPEILRLLGRLLTARRHVCRHTESNWAAPVPRSESGTKPNRPKPSQARYSPSGERRIRRCRHTDRRPYE